MAHANRKERMKSKESVKPASQKEMSKTQHKAEGNYVFLVRVFSPTHTHTTFLDINIHLNAPFTLSTTMSWPLSLVTTRLM